MRLRLRLPGLAARALLAAALLPGPGRPAFAHDGPHGDAASVIDGRSRDDPARLALLRQAEAELARGDAVAAGETFERAAMMLHAADTEMGLVRGHMQAGQYGRALAFCAHTAGVHRESPAASALYAWLVRAGGQDAFAERTLAQALQRAPLDEVLLAARRAFAAPLPVATAALLQTPQRMAPQAVMLGGQGEVPAAARAAGSALLVGRGEMALVPAGLLRGADGLWVRNGLGQTTRAQRQQDAALEAQGVARLRLESPLDAGPATAPASREPFAGSPGFAFQYAAQQDAQPAWPWLSQGFFAAVPLQPSARRQLGIELPAGPDGGPVFDREGHLAGMVLAGPKGEPLMLPASQWQPMEAVDGPVSSPPPLAAGSQRTATAEQVYERGLRVALQVIVLPR